MYEADGSSAGKQVAQPQITSSSSSSNDHNQQQPAQLGRVLGESSSPSRQGGLQSAAAAAASPSKSCTPRSPRGLRAAATAPTSADSTTPRSTAAAAFGPDQSTLIEVRRVGPREAFGEDDVSSTSCSSRQQTAVACGANSLTWAQLLSHTPLTEPASGGSPGCVGTFSSAPGTTSNSTAAAEAEAATPAVASSAPGGTGGRGFTDGRRRSITRTAANVVVPEGGVVLLQLSADDYGAVLEGRLSVMMEDKVGRTRTRGQQMSIIFTHLSCRYASTDQRWNGSYSATTCQLGSLCILTVESAHERVSACVCLRGLNMPATYMASNLSGATVMHL